MRFKTRPFEVKALGKSDGLGDGQFRALVSVFDNIDSVGDVVRKGAFTKTLGEWADSGNPVPVIWSHRMDDPEYNLGKCLELAETDDGLEIVGELDTEGSPKAALVHRLMQQKRVTQFSFAYDVISGGTIDLDGEKAYELTELKLFEVGPTPVGANQATELLDVKSAGNLEEQLHRLQLKHDALEVEVAELRATRTAAQAPAPVAQVLANPRALDLISLGL